MAFLKMRRKNALRSGTTKPENSLLVECLLQLMQQALQRTLHQQGPLFFGYDGLLRAVILFRQ